MSAIPPENPDPSSADGWLGLMYVGKLTRQQVQQISPTALAYLGDAVYELYVRSRYLLPPKRIQAYHHQVVAQVRAESQAKHLRSLVCHLTPAESDIIRRGRNAAAGRPKRVSAQTYQQATSLEALLGYLFLSDPQRLGELLTQLELDNEPTIFQTHQEKSGQDPGEIQ